ncbi:MAG: hypothetical protein IKX20_09630 [Paludibacteraceae bacterium]|nr:hypothetical protein [Paludibacteraceae bacterium]
MQEDALDRDGRHQPIRQRLVWRQMQNLRKKEVLRGSDREINNILPFFLSMETLTIFDDQFSKVKDLLHFPWVGCDYPANKIKVLVLGDSHYTVNPDSSFCEEEYQRCLVDKDFTREILDDAVNRDDIWSMFKGLYSLFGVTPYSAERLFWSKIAFGNFVQRPMKRSDAKPTSDDFKQAWFCLLDIIDIIKPNICLFIGIRGWVSNGYINIENRGYCSILDDTVRISRCTPWRATIMTKNGVNTRAIAIHHTSQGFSPQIWRDYLTLREPVIFSSIKESLD